MPRRMSVWPVAIHTRTPLGIGIIVRSERSEPVEAHRRPTRCRRARDYRSQARSPSPRTSFVVRSSLPANVLPRRTGRRRHRSDLDRQQNRVVSPARTFRARLPSPCEYQALRDAVPSCDLAHHSPRHQRLFDDPRLLVLAPTPSAFDPPDLPIHLRVTLSLALRSPPSRPPPSQQGGRRRRDTISRPFSAVFGPRVSKL